MALMLLQLLLFRSDEISIILVQKVHYSNMFFQIYCAFEPSIS